MPTVGRVNFYPRIYICLLLFFGAFCVPLKCFLNIGFLLVPFVDQYAIAEGERIARRHFVRAIFTRAAAIKIFVAERIRGEQTVRSNVPICWVTEAGRVIHNLFNGWVEVIV